MGCLNSIFKFGPDEMLYRGRKMLGVRAATLSSALSLEFKTIPRSLVVKTFDIAWALGGL